MREDVKDLLDRAAGWYQPRTIKLEDVMRRLRRERRRGRLAAAILAFAVFAPAGALTWTAFRPSRGGGPGGARVLPSVSATEHGVSVTYPGFWTLVDLWPLANSIASWPQPTGSSISIPAATPERGGLPLLQLSNEDLGLRSACGLELTGGEAVLYVALNGGPYRVNPDGSPIWSHVLSEGEGPCGRGWYAYKASTEPAGDSTSLSTPYLVFAGFGPGVSQTDRDAMFSAFDSLRLAPFDMLHPPAADSPSYVTQGSASATQDRCLQASASGDFDGDRTVDHAEFFEVVSGVVSCERAGDVASHLRSQELVIQFGSGQTLKQPFTDCQGGLCAFVFAATDLEADGRDELAVDVSSAAATGLVELYRVDPEGIQPLLIAEPGDAPYVEPGLAILGGGFDSGVQSPVSCRVLPDGTHELVSVHSDNVGQNIRGPWNVHTTTLALEGNTLVVTSSKDSKETFATDAEVFQEEFRNGCR